MIIAVVGSGGKTTLIKKLAARYRSEGKTVLVTTTTHMFIEEETLLTDDAGTSIEALQEKGYNPINQIVGYILSEDPTYITNYNNARSMICKIDRDELMQALVRDYLFAKD